MGCDSSDSPPLTQAPGADRVRDALAALKDGKAQLQDVEALIAALIEAGAVSRTDALGVLEAAVREGTLTPETLRRLELDAGDSSRTRYRAPEAATQRKRDVTTDPNLTTAHGGSTAIGGGTIEPGALLSGRYYLERKLGEGGMGDVYFARDRQVEGECFAVKVLKPYIREHADSLELLREEVRKTRSLHHPNIVGVYSLNVDSSGVYMLMECLEGQTLSALLDDEFGRGMPLMRAWPLIKDIGAALSYAHDHSVIHCDLKPSNVFVASSGRAKLLDFGIARAVRGRARRIETGATSSALTPAYASCEMLEGATPELRDDVYAFAAVIYELLTGRHPFEGRTAVEARTGGLVPAPVASLSRAQNAALVRGLAFERAKRTASVEKLLTELEAKPRVRWPVGVALGVTALAILSVGIWFVFLRSSPTGPAVDSTALRSRMSRMKDRAEQAQRQLAIDTSQRLWQTFSQRFDAARQGLRSADPHAADLVAAADGSLNDAIQRGQRWMKAGSLPAEIEQAVALCRTPKQQCSASDFAAEAGRMAQLKPFELDQAEITNREFAEFVDATGYTTGAERAHGLYDYSGNSTVFRSGASWKTLREELAATHVDTSDYPVRGIDFEAARAFCNWRHRRLPTGDEWEFVARGVERHVFPWGNEPLRDVSPAVLLPVTQQQRTGRFGNRGLGGSLWEWVDEGSAHQPALRGASWRDSNVLDQRLAARRLEDPTRAFVDSGMRCARVAEIWPDP
jgi:formylglycine-generating enzyme required for sulfatase activity